jgi:predicted ABC-type ATPase
MIKNQQEARIAEQIVKGFYKDNDFNRKHNLVGKRYGRDKHAEVSHAERIKLNEDTTKDRHFNRKEWRYSASRQKLHEEIVMDNFYNYPSQEKPTCVIVVGGGGSGKSHIYNTKVKPNLPDADSYAYLNNDDIKEMLPESHEFRKIDAKSTANRLHEESADITRLSLDFLTHNKKNFVLDATFSNYSSAVPKIEKMIKQGYKIKLIGVTANRQVVEQSVKDRYERSGRYVPISIALGAQDGARHTLHNFIKNHSDKFEDIQVYNNDGLLEKKDPIHVYDNGEIKHIKYHQIKRYFRGYD